ncbi:MAG TPA: BadF/BadG/BcrA/BcrD ATPase family protein [Microlunatus sp.]
MTGLLIGADVGGTSTRVAIADHRGMVRAVARQPAGNPNAVGVDTSASRVRAAITDALGQLRGQEFDPDPVRSGIDAVVLGMAGFATALDAGAEFLAAALPDEVGSPTVRIVSDLAVGYASATPLPRGYVVIAGTGSGAAEVDRGEIIARRGSWGWLLGDEGAGFWLGREAVRNALLETERRLPYGPLTRAVLQALEIGPDDPTEALAGLTRVPYLSQPVKLAELAPYVTGLVDSDPAAAAICARAADQLARLVLDLQPMPGRPIVATGSVLQTPGPIRSAFTACVQQQLGSAVIDAHSGLVGSLWLAAGAAADRTAADGAGGDGLPDAPVHERLLATLDQH